MAASYSYSVDDSQTVLTITVYGLVKRDRINYFIRRSDGSTNLADPDHYTNDAGVTSYSQEFAVLTPHTSYVINVGVVDVNGIGGWLGSKEFNTGAAKIKPEPWSWSGIIWSGAPLENLTAARWTNFQDRIDAVRAWKGLPAWGFTRPVSGQTPLVTLFSQAESAIKNMGGPIGVPSTRTLSMTYFNTLAAALNVNLE